MEYKFEMNDQNIEILGFGYKEYLSPKSKLPVFNIGVLAKVITTSRRYGRNQEIIVSYWASLGPNTTSLSFNHVEVQGRKAASRAAKFKKNFPNVDLERFLERGIDVKDFFSAYHSGLIITDWYSEQLEKSYR